MSFAFPGFESCRSHDGSYRLNASLRQCACDGFGSYPYCGMLNPSFGRDITLTYEWLGGSVSTRKSVRRVTLSAQRAMLPRVARHENSRARRDLSPDRTIPERAMSGMRWCQRTSTIG